MSKFKKVTLTMDLYEVLCQVLEKVGFDEEKEDTTRFEWIEDNVTTVDVPEDFIRNLD